MSKVYTLVRFSKTGNIYYGSYDTIGQRARNYICTPKEAYDAADDVYDMTLFWRERKKKEMVVTPTLMSVLLALNQTAMMLKFMYQACI